MCTLCIKECMCSMLAIFSQFSIEKETFAYIVYSMYNLKTVFFSFSLSLSLSLSPPLSYSLISEYHSLIHQLELCLFCFGVHPKDIFICVV